MAKVDIIDVMLAVNKGDLKIVVKNGFFLLEHTKSGERVRLNEADVEQVVRCKDCKHREGGLCPMEGVELYPWFATKNDAFCSYGERRDGE